MARGLYLPSLVVIEDHIATLSSFLTLSAMLHLGGLMVSVISLGFLSCDNMELLRPPHAVGIRGFCRFLHGSRLLDRPAEGGDAGVAKES